MYRHQNAGYPYLLIATSEEDRVIRENRKKISPEVKFFRWDIAEGMKGFANPNGDADLWIWQVLDEKVNNPVDALQAIQSLPENSIIFMYDYHEFLKDVMVARCALNLKDHLKASSKMVVFLSHTVDIPPAMQDVVKVLDFDMPDEAGLKELLARMCGDTKMPMPGNQDAIIDAMRGLTLEGAENALALSLVETGGLAYKIILDAKAAMLKSTGYLKYLTYGETFDDLFGLEYLKDYAPKCVASGKGKGILICGYPGTGKCLGKGTPVIKYDGQVCPVETVRQGDVLMGPDSTPRKVINTTSGYGPLFRVEPVKGDPYVVNENHVLSLKKTGTHDIHNLSVSEYFAASSSFRENAKGWRVGVEFKYQKTPIPPYLLGVWLGDGDSVRPAFNLNLDDVEIVQYLQDYVDQNNLFLQTTPIPDKHCALHRIVSQIGAGRTPNNTLLNQLRTLDLINNKHLPMMYKINSKESRLQLLAGIIDTDGYANIVDGYCEIITKFPTLAEDILFLARSLGFAAYKSDKFATINGKKLRYDRISLSGNLSEIPTITKRRKFNPRRQIKDVLKTGVTVTPIEPGEYYGFELDRDHMFLLGDFTVTHNSHFAKALAAYTEAPCLNLNFSALRGGVVGVTEANTQDAFKRIEAFNRPIVFVDEIEKSFEGVGQGGKSDGGVGDRIGQEFLKYWEDRQVPGSYWVATANGLDTLLDWSGGALISRFDAVFFLDMPTKAECQGIARIWSEKLNVDIPKNFNFEGWTGRDIKKLANTMGMMNVCADKAAKFVIPTAQALGPRLGEIKKKAANVCIPASASEIVKPGVRRVKMAA